MQHPQQLSREKARRRRYSSPLSFSLVLKPINCKVGPSEIHSCCHFAFADSQMNEKCLLCNIMPCNRPIRVLFVACADYF